MRTPRLIAVLTLALLVGACEGWGTELETTCTDPCPYGLEVVLLGTLPAEYSLEATVTVLGSSGTPFEYPSWVQQCTADQSCELVGYFPYFAPPRVTLTYRTADTAVARVVQPEYEVTERSAECGGDCKYAYIEMRVSESEG
ncbi:MAG: hypothetical protein R6U63_12305 [Longimicrobiales bacterium]